MWVILERDFFQMNRLNSFHNGVILGILGLHSVRIHIILLMLAYTLQTQWDILLTPLYRFIFRPSWALFVKMLFSILKQCTKQTSFHWQVLLNTDSSYFFRTVQLNGCVLVCIILSFTNYFTKLENKIWKYL